MSSLAMGSAVNAVEFSLNPFAVASDLTINEAFLNQGGWAFANYGKAVATNSIAIKTGELRGCFTIQAPFIRIACDEFKFTGTIICDKECTIFVKKVFDPHMFIKEGRGRFSAVVSRYDLREHTIASLGDMLQNTILRPLLSVTNEDIERAVKEIRHYAHYNKLDQQELTTHVQQRLKDEISYHADRADKKIDNAELVRGLKNCIVPAASVGFCALTFKFREPIVEELERIFDQGTISDNCSGLWMLSVPVTAILAGAFLYDATKNFAAWLHPRHKEKHEKLVELAPKLTSAFETAYISEDQVIEL